MSSKAAPLLRWLLVSALAVCAGLCAGQARGQTGGGDGGFGNVRFPIQPADGVIGFSARSGWLWQAGRTHRIHLRTDVRVELGGDVFVANEASIWLEPIDDGLYQVFAVFGGVRADQGSIDVRAEVLSARGVVRSVDAVRVRLDAQFGGPPDARSDAWAFHSTAGGMFASRVLGRGTPVYAEGLDDRSMPAAVRGVDQGPRPVFVPGGVFSFSVGDRIVIEGGGEGERGTITATGGVVMQYVETGSGRSVEMKAQRAVVFLKRDASLDRSLARLSGEDIEGVYLEGGVTGGDGRWSVRSPKVYLDVDRGRALMLDAVFWTNDERTGMPVYVRADAVRQESDRVFSAERARLGNTAFYEPDVFIGVRRLEVTLEKGAESDRGAVKIAGRNVTLNALGVPVLWLPGFSGDADSFPLRRLSISDSNRTGGLVATRWNLGSLLGLDWPGVEVDLLLDYYSERGFAAGFDGTWNRDGHRGGVFAYLVPDDGGTDFLSPGTRIGRDGETRGMLWARDLWRIRDNWTLVSELSHISDEAFVPAFFPELGSTVEDFRNRLRLERQGEQTLFALEGSGFESDFIASEHLLQTPGYRVDRLPEATFVSGQREIFSEWFPGIFTHGFEARAGSLRLRFSEASASEYGFVFSSLADDAFGTAPGESIGDMLRAQGLDERAVSRFDTRHEVVATLQAGPIRVTPFVVGRLTAYDDSFDAYSPGEDDETRLWGAVGVTLSTTLTRVHDGVESEAFDLHRIRHIVEPSLTVWGSDSNITTGEVPVFDDDVENLITGGLVRAAVDQTWQTKRGGPGRWRDVDVLQVRTEYVWSSDRAGQSAIPRWYESRPELGRPGEYAGMSAVWHPTEVVAVAGEVTYDLENDEVARGSGGVLVEHRPGFVTSAEYRRIEAVDATYAAFSARYRMTEKYGLNTSVTYNFDESDFQDFTAIVQRRFQAGTLGVTVTYNNIRGETSLGFTFSPDGARRGLTVDPSFGG